MDATELDRPSTRRRVPRRYGSDTPEFARVVNLADAVFAIAMTLLVLDLHVADVPAGELAGALADQAPQLIAFALAFVLVANAWWQHHRIFATLAWVEPGMIGINMALLAGVALVPFPTSLVGAHPGERAAVLPFVALFVVLTGLCLAIILRARRLGAWRKPMPAELFGWILADWVAALSLTAVAFVVALWAPVAGLVVLAIGPTAAVLLVSRRGPRERVRWC
jgi:uncharacterized membrane protein